ncbi:MAG TPA: amidase family protein, partial [Ktedonobacteraceae bacterium]
PRPAFEMYRAIQRPEAALAHMQKGWLSEKLDLYTERTREHLLEGQKLAAVDYLRAQYEKRLFSSAARAVLQRVDALFLPTLPVPAIPIAQIDQEIVIEGVTKNATVSLMSLTMPFNLAGLPACSFPGGFTSHNLPIGLQVVGKAFEESTVLRIAHAYQQLTDWHRREIG